MFKVVNGETTKHFRYLASATKMLWKLGKGSKIYCGDELIFSI